MKEHIAILLKQCISHDYWMFKYKRFYIDCTKISDVANKKIA
jgi:hypothetical protein